MGTLSRWSIGDRARVCRLRSMGNWRPRGTVEDGMTLLHSAPMPGPRSNSKVSRTRALTWSALALLLLLLNGCEGPVGLNVEEVRVEVRAALDAYLPQLALAYDDMDPSHLADVAVPKELAHVQLRVNEMAARGERIVSAIQQLTLDDIRLARSTAYVLTTEVWDIELRTIGSDHVLYSYPNTQYRVRYQLKLDGGQWRIVFRQLTETEQQ